MAIFAAQFPMGCTAQRSESRGDQKRETWIWSFMAARRFWLLGVPMQHTHSPAHWNTHTLSAQANANDMQRQRQRKVFKQVTKTVNEPISRINIARPLEENALSWSASACE